MYAEAAPYSRDLNLKGYHKPMFYKDVFCKGSAIGVHSTRKLISPFSIRIYSIRLCSTRIQSMRIYFTGDLFFKDQFNGNLFYKGSQQPLFYRNLFYRSSIQWGSIS